MTVAKWRKVEHLEDKTSRPNRIYYALSPFEQKIIKKVRKRGLFSLDDLVISLKPYIEKLNRINCWRTLKDIKRFQDTWNYYKKLKIFQGKTPYQITCEWFKKKPEIFLRNTIKLIEKQIN